MKLGVATEEKASESEPPEAPAKPRVGHAHGGLVVRPAYPQPVGRSGASVPAAGARNASIFADNIWIMRITGFWRFTAAYGEDHPAKRTWTRSLAALAQGLYFNLNVITNAVFLGSKLMHSALDTDTIRNVTENLSDVLCIAFSLLQLLVLLETEERLRALLKRIDEEFEHVFTSVYGAREGRRRMWQQKRHSRRVVAITFLSFMTCGLCFAVIATATSKRKSSLPIAIWTPFSQDDPGTLALLLMVEGVGVVLTVAGSGALSALFLSCFVIVRSHFRAVQEYFQAQSENLPDGGWSTAERERAEAGLLQGAKLHQAVISLAEELCQVLAPFLTVQLSTIVFMICVALFQVSMNPADAGNIRFFLLATNVICEAFILCWMGTSLSDEATEVQTGLEWGCWYLHGTAVGYIVKFAMQRAQKPPCVLVANNALVGLPLFLELIRSSYSLLAFLRKRATTELE